MKAVLRHELGSYFTSLSGYVFGGFLLLFVGIYTLAYNLQMNYTNFEYVMGGMSFVFLVIVPILTMRVLAEEKNQKTDQLLYSLPISMTEVVLGKYLAMMVMLLIPMFIVCVYPLILSAFGNVYLPAAYGAIAGFFFLGAALIAIGMFVSSVTESQAVAAGLCFVVMLVNYFLSDLASFVSTSAFASFAAFTAAVVVLMGVVQGMTKNTTASLIVGIIGETCLLVPYILDSTKFEGLFPEIMESLSLFERFYVFVDGQFDITGIVYYITIAAVFLYLSVQSMEKRRWSE